nr:MAG TPA: hypothetical protein [Caudoviricetes sp.]
MTKIRLLCGFHISSEFFQVCKMTAHYNVNCMPTLQNGYSNQCNAPHLSKCTPPCPWGALVSKLELFAMASVLTAFEKL